jgi:hypothetical protein
LKFAFFIIAHSFDSLANKNDLSALRNAKRDGIENQTTATRQKSLVFFCLVSFGEEGGRGLRETCVIKYSLIRR